MPSEHEKEEGPMSEEAQMRLKYGAIKGGLTRSDGEQPEPSEEDVMSKGGMSKEAQERLVEGARKGGLATKDKSGEEAAREKPIQIDEEKYKTKSELSDVAKTTS